MKQCENNDRKIRCGQELHYIQHVASEVPVFGLKQGHRAFEKRERDQLPCS